MVFYRLGAGFLVGLSLPFMVKDLVYMTISNAFLRPHLKFRMERERLDKDRAVSTKMLDNYLKDTVGSFLIFWFVIGPVLYDAYIRKNDEQEKKDAAPKLNEIGHIEDDKYT
jgi:hypothetical protein